LQLFFDSTASGDGYLIRQLTDEIVINNIYWLKLKYEDLNDFFAAADEVKLF